VTEPGAGAPLDPHRPALVVSALLLGDALQLTNGFYSPPALGLVVAALALAWAALLWPRRLGAVVPDRPAAVYVIAAAGVLMQVALIRVSPIGMYFARPYPDQHAGFVPLLAAGALAVLAAALPWRPARGLAAGVLLVAVAALGVLTYRGSPDPAIDVVPVHHEAFAALARGDSPYSMTFADIYRGREAFYPPGMTEGGRVLYGFPYPPLSLAMAWPGHAAGDFRYAELAALVVGGGFIIAAGRLSAVAVAAAAVLLFTPRGFFALEQAWTEPFAIAWLAGAIWAAATRRPLLAAGLLGLAVATKQYLALAVPAAALLGDDQVTRRRAVATTVGVAAVALLPALADLPGFLHSVVMVQVREVLRTDSLSLAVPLAGAGLPLSGAVYGALVIAAALMATWRAPATPAGLAAAIAITLFTAFAFGKKAFCNYYVMVIAALVLAVAVRRNGDDGSAARESVDRVIS
jgi:hypothetical protein